MDNLTYLFLRVLAYLSSDTRANGRDGRDDKRIRNESDYRFRGRSGVELVEMTYK